MADTKHYTELGLVNTRAMFKKAMEGGYAIPAYNFNNMEQLQGIVLGCAQSKSPVILQVSGSARKYANPTFLPYMAMGAVEMVKALGVTIPVALHLDHGDSFELAKSCIDSGFSSVMLDGSLQSTPASMQAHQKQQVHQHERRAHPCPTHREHPGRTARTAGRLVDGRGLRLWGGACVATRATVCALLVLAGAGHGDDGRVRRGTARAVRRRHGIGGLGSGGRGDRIGDGGR